MIRVYISSWELRTDEAGGGYVWNPITDAMESLPTLPAETPRDQRNSARLLYPDADADGKPDGPTVMIIARGPNAEDYQGLPGVDMLPPFDLSTAISSIPQPTVDSVVAMLADHGIPFPVIEGTATAGELLDRIVGSFSPGARPITQMFAGREADFS